MGQADAEAHVVAGRDLNDMHETQRPSHAGGTFAY